MPGSATARATRQQSRMGSWGTMGSPTLMAWDSVHLFECPTRIFYGSAPPRDSASARASSASRAPCSSPIPGSPAAGTVERVADHMRGAGVDASSTTAPSRTRPRRTWRRSSTSTARARCDGLVGLGGGSSMDAAKAAVRADRERRLDMGLPRQGSRAAAGPPGGLPADHLRHRRRGDVRRRHHRPRRALQGRLRRRATSPPGSRSSIRSSCSPRRRTSSRRPAPTRSRTRSSPT